MKLIKNIGQLVTMQGASPKKGKEMNDIGIINNSYIIIEDGIITKIGQGNVDEDNFIEIYDAKGCVVTPGLIDAHTHLVFGGSREHEFKLKLEGISYLDILKQGGGIHYTVDKTRSESEDKLYKKSYKFLDYMLTCGVTTVESKSGYGLDNDTEMKQLRVNRRLNNSHVIDVISTFLGAHAIPMGVEEDEFITSVINMLDDAKKHGAEFCDVFCEDGAISLLQSKRLLSTAKEKGFKLKIHADEVIPLGGTNLACELNATSVDHLMAVNDEGIEYLKKSNVIANILPATTFSLGKEYAPARKMIDNNIAVAISSDFNPGSCPNPNLQFTMQLATLGLKMTPSEVFSAVTINAAHAIDRADKIGSIEVGKQADIVIFDAPNIDYVLFHFGMLHTKGVFKNGVLVKK